MRCDHRYKLVGYRYREADSESTAVPSGPSMDAVMTCLKCPQEKLVPVDEIPPAPIIQAAPIGSAQEEE